MDYLYEALIRKKEELQKIIAQLSVDTKPQNTPEGKLRISHSHNHPQYYLCKGEGKEKTVGTYIRKENINIAATIAQNEYKQKLLSEARKELSSINRMLRIHIPERLEYVYEKLHSSRQLIVKPGIMSDERYIEQWLEVKYEGKEFWENTPEIYTEKGERVRSKSEKIIADMLNRYHIPYRYEYPVNLKGIGMVHPDFTILDVRERKEIYLEHFGMMDDLEYNRKAILKVEAYQRNGYILGDKLLVTFETSKYPIDTRTLHRIIKKYVYG